MKKMVFILIFLTALFFPMKTYAADDFLQEIDDLTSQYNTGGINLLESDSEDIFDYIKEKIKSTASEPLKLAIKLISVIVLYSVAAVFNADNVKNNLVYENVCTLLIFINLLTPLNEISVMIAENLYSVKNFMVSFLPVFAGISLASGEIFSSTIFTGFLLSAMVFASDFCISIILPSVKMYFALIISNALSPFIKLQSVSDFYIKTVKSVMKVFVSVICFLLTMQTTVSRGKDTLAVKAGKLFAGSAIPVIGSSLQDAVSSVYAGMESIKGFAGAAGLATIAGIFLPSLIILAIYWCITNLLYIFSDVFGARQIGLCIKGYIEITGLMISVVVLYMVMLIFSVTIFIAITNGV